MLRPVRAFLPLAVFALSCGPSVRRDLGAVEQRAITFDDMCHLQEWFDQRLASHARPYAAENELSTETARTERDDQGRLRPVTIGEGTYILAARSDRTRFNRVLHEEYRRLPEMHMTASETPVKVHIDWWQAGGIRRVRNDRDVVLTVNGQTVALPPHPCVGEFLFGESAYVMRRCFMEAEAARARGEIPGDCSVAQGPAADASVRADATATTVAPPSPAEAFDASVDAAADAPLDAPVAVAPADAPDAAPRRDAPRG